MKVFGTAEAGFDRELRFNEELGEDVTSKFILGLFSAAGLDGILVGEGGAFGPNGPVDVELDLARLPSAPAVVEIPLGRYFCLPVRHEAEVFARLLVPDGEGVYRATEAAKLIETFLDLRHSQRMMADVHLSTLEDSYSELQARHEELAASETRYRELAASLEERVNERARELEQAHKQLRQQEKMASIGQLAAGVAHEINNPTGFVSSNLQTLQTYFGNLAHILKSYRAAPLAKPEDQARLRREWERLDLEFILGDVELLITQSLSGTERIAKIVQGLSRFSHTDKNEVESYDLNGLLESVLELLHNEIKHRAELVKDFRELPVMVGIPSQLSQVFINLVVNALQSMTRFGRIEISTRFDDGCAVVAVRDNGAGIAAEHLPRLFEPFFTTKPVGQGTGLGLSISWEIVHHHGGRIEVESEAGRGTLFRVVLPRGGIQEVKP